MKRNGKQVLKDTCSFPKVFSAFTKKTLDQRGQWHYVLIKDGFPSKDLAGYFKNLYIDYRYVFIQICLEDIVQTSNVKKVVDATVIARWGHTVCIKEFTK